MTDKKNKRHYWQIKEGKHCIFTGTFAECWERLCLRFGHFSLNQLVNDKISIQRVAQDKLTAKKATVAKKLEKELKNV